MASPLLVEGDVVLGVLNGTLFGQRTENTFHWRVTNTIPGYSISNFVQDLADEMLPEYRLMLSEQWTAYSTYARRLTPNPTRGFELLTSADPGGVDGTALPPQVTVVMSRLTNAPGPKGRGRIYIPGVPQTFITDGQVNATGLGVYPDFLPWLDLPWEITDGPTLEPVLWRPPATTTDVESAVLRRITRTQRRREIGVGI